MVGRKLNRELELGLTLVELLVVLVILALASSVVLVTAPPSRPLVRDEAERFAARMALALDEAITSAQPMRVTLDGAGYVFERFTPDGWTPIADDRFLSRRTLGRSVTQTPAVEDAANDNSRELGVDEDSNEEEAEEGVLTIPLDPLGAQLGFSVNFSSSDGVWTVAVDQGAKVSVKENG